MEGNDVEDEDGEEEVDYQIDIVSLQQLFKANNSCAFLKPLSLKKTSMLYPFREAFSNKYL